MTERTVRDISDEELLRRAVLNSTPSARSAPRWVVVMNLLGLGSTYSHQICHRFGLDPDEVIKVRRGK